MGTLSRTWRMMGASWTVLKKDTELLVFPLLSTTAVLLLVGSFLLPMLDVGMEPYLRQLSGDNPLVYVWMFLFYFANSFVIIFFNAAIVGCALARMTGDDPTVRFGLQIAWKRVGQIFLWALVTSTVGFLLQAIEERVGAAGRLIVSVLGMAWSVTSYLVVPVLVHRGVGPVDAYKESVSMLKSTWGEQLTGTISFSLLFVVLGLPPVALVVGLATTGSLVATGTAIAVSVVYLALLALVQATLQAIYQAAVYAYAYAGEAPPGFQEGDLSGTFRQRSTGLG